MELLIESAPDVPVMSFESVFGSSIVSVFISQSHTDFLYKINDIYKKIKNNDEDTEMINEKLSDELLDILFAKFKDENLDVSFKSQKYTSGGKNQNINNNNKNKESTPNPFLMNYKSEKFS